MKKKVWVLLDNRIGSANQAKGVENALDKHKFAIEEKKIEYNFMAALPNFIRGKTLLGLNKKSRELFKGAMPDIVISSSRRTVPVARYIKKISKNKTKLVQLMHPGRTGMTDFSLIFVPEHDKNKKNGDNVEYIVGSAHKITQDTLAEAHKKWNKEFIDYARPLTAVIVGGAIKKKPFSVENAQNFGKLLNMFHKRIGGTFLFTTSRRTGEQAQNAILAEIKDVPAYAYLWGDKRENPYMGFLSESDNIIVTGDSVSMCSEAVGSGKKVYIFEGENWLTPKHKRFVKSLYDNDLAYSFNGEIKHEQKERKMFNPAVEIAKKIELKL